MTTEFMIIGIVGLLSWWAIKTNNAFIFMILFAVAVPLGLYIPDIVSSTASTSGVDMALGMGIVMFGFLCAGWSFKLLLTPEANNV